MRRLLLALAFAIPLVPFPASASALSTSGCDAQGFGFKVTADCEVINGSGLTVNYVIAQARNCSWVGLEGRFDVWRKWSDGTMQLLLSSSYRPLAKDCTLRGVKYDNGGKGWTLGGAQEWCAGFWFWSGDGKFGPLWNHDGGLGDCEGIG